MRKTWIVYPLIIAAVATLGVLGLAKDTIVQGQWAAGPVRIDGLDQDWQDATFLTDPGSKAQYAVKNDGANLYILFLFKDPASASTIEYTGMKVFFNADDKKSRDLGILFTKRALPVEAVIAEMEKRGEAVTEERKAELRKQKTHMVFVEEPINTKTLSAPTDPAVKTDPPVYRSAARQRVQYFEFRIPLSRTNEPRGIGAGAGKTIKLGFEWGGMTKEVLENQMADMVSRAGSAHQGAELSDSLANPRDNAGTLQGGGEYRRDPRTMLHSFWLDLKLAAQ
jgi:hypothetical protein